MSLTKIKILLFHVEKPLYIYLSVSPNSFFESRALSDLFILA